VRESTFAAKIDELDAEVGHGDLDMSVTVDQVYAMYQHDNPEFKHPRGGEAYYLAAPLSEKWPEMVDRFSDVIAGDASPVEVWSVNAEELAGDVAERAPVEFIVLRQSAHPEVTDDGALAYDRPPTIPRLTQAELDEIRRVGEPIVNPEEWLRQRHYHRGEGGHWLSGGA